MGNQISNSSCPLITSHQYIFSRSGPQATILKRLSINNSVCIRGQGKVQYFETKVKKNLDPFIVL